MTDQPKKSLGFFRELKRRNVYTVAIGYIALAYLALQFVDLLIPSTRLPDWADEFFLALAIVGFPIALIIGWVFEMTSGGVHWTQPEGDKEADGTSMFIKWQPIVAAVILIMLSVFAWVSLTEPESTSVEEIGSVVAVLPFETLGSDQANAFTEGIHAGVLTRLSNVSGLDIISRTSVRAYRNTEKSLPEIARELGATWVVLAEVQEVGSNVLVNARLIKALDDRQVWAQEYRRTISAETVFEIQSDLASSIIKALHARISPSEARRIEQTPTLSLEAYRLKVLGRRESDKRTADGLQRGAKLLQQAIDLDPNYASAWVGLAESLAIAYDYGYSDDEDLLVQAEKASQHGIELDPESGEAHAVMGVVHFARHEGPESILALNRAIVLQPSNGGAHSWLSWGSLLFGDVDEGIKNGKRAVAVDPLSGEAVSNLALSFLSKGEYEKGLTESQHSLQLLPEWSTARLYKGTALYHLGRYAEAENVLTGLTVEWAGSGASSALALAMLAQGDSAGALALLKTLEQSDDHFSAGLVHAVLGDYDSAYQSWLRGDNWNAWSIIAMRYFYPDVLGPFRDDPLFAEIIANIDREWGLK